MGPRFLILGTDVRLLSTATKVPEVYAIDHWLAAAIIYVRSTRTGDTMQRFLRAGVILAPVVTLLQLEQQKAEMLALVAGWSDARMAYRPEVGRWSAAEMFDHIVKVEDEILAAAQTGLLTPHRVGASDRLRTAFLTRVFASNRRVQVPASAPQVLPDAQPPFDAVRQHWDTSRSHLAKFVNTFPADQLDRGVFRHPVGGWMNLEEVLNFFSVHMLHHGFQLDRLSAGSYGL